MTNTLSVPRKNRSRATCLAWLLFVLTAARMCLLCLPAPITAYANNFDFIRQSACVGVWEHYTDRTKTEKHPGAPVDTLIFDGDRLHSACLNSSDNLFPWLASRFHAKGAALRLRDIGLIKILVTLALLAYCLALDIPGPLRLGLAVAGYLALSDFAILCYYDTLYTEVTGIVGVVALCFLLAITVHKRAHPSRVQLAAYAVLVLATGLSRAQDAPIAAALALTYAGVMLRRGLRGPALVMAFIALLTPTLQSAINPRHNPAPASIAHANSTDTFLAAVLPAATDKAAALRMLHLPQSCATAIGTDWYMIGAGPHPCPAVFKTGRWRLPPLFMAQPNTFFLPVLNAVRQSRPFLLLSIGHFETPELPAALRVRLIAATSLSTWLDSMGPSAYCALMAAAALLAAVSVVGLFREKRPDRIAALTLVTLGGAVGVYALLSSVFGDGYFDMARHAILLLIGVALQLGGIATIAASIETNILRRFSKGIAALRVALLPRK